MLKPSLATSIRPEQDAAYPQKDASHSRGTRSELQPAHLRVGPRFAKPSPKQYGRNSRNRKRTRCGWQSRTRSQACCTSAGVRSLNSWARSWASPLLPLPRRTRQNNEPYITPLRAPVHKDIVQPIANAAAAVFQLPDQAEEVRTSISDLLHSGDGAAVDWLTRSCFAFVCACSLGLEVRTQAALESIIARTALVLDTDVILSLLSADEAPHDSVQALTKEWREFGGQVLVTREVLSEVAHHAWIAQNDLDHVIDLLPATHLDRQVLSKNAFVRGFGRLLERGEVKPSHWSRWMRQIQREESDGFDRDP